MLCFSPAGGQHASILRNQLVTKDLVSGNNVEVKSEPLSMIGGAPGEARADDDPSYQQLNVLAKRAIRKDMRNNICQRVQNSSSSNMYRNLKPVIAPKRGPVTEPSGLSADDLNKYFTSIGKVTRDEVDTQFGCSGRTALKTRLPRVNAGSL